MRVPKLFAWGLALVLFGASGAQAQSVIDFETLPAGTIVDQVATGAGIGGDPVAGFVAVNGTSRTEGNVAVVFNADCSDDCTGEDFDLSHPAFGHVLIAADNLIDADGDMLVDDPGDDVFGSFVFDFEPLAGLDGVTVISMDVLDIDVGENEGTVELFDANSLIGVITLPVTGDGGADTLPIGVQGVVRMEVHLGGSGAIDGIVFDTGAECGDGQRDPAEECDGDDDAMCPGGCDTDCTCIEAFCGDGMINAPGEQCDGADVGNCATQTCTSECTCAPAICGDGIVNDPSEECDGADDVGCGVLECQSDCLCQGQLFISCPGRVRFDPVRTDLDRLDMHGRVFPRMCFDPTTVPITFRLKDANGLIYEGSLAPGACKNSRGRAGLPCTYRDPNARFTSGIGRFSIHGRGHSSLVFRLRAFDDLSAATDADMTFEIVMGGQGFQSEGAWKRTQRPGWRLPRRRPPRGFSSLLNACF